MSNRNMQLCALFCNAVLLLVGVQAAEEVELPNFIKTCDHESPDYGSCLKQSIEDAWPTIVAEGIPALDVPKLNPLKIDEMEHNYQLGLIKSHTLVRDLKAEGLADLKFQAIRPNRTADRMSLEIDFEIPSMFVEGYYKADSTIGSMKNGGKGYFNMTSEGTNARWFIDGRIENDRWVIEHIRENPEFIKMDKFKVYFDDIFNGNKDLNKAALTFINDNWRLLMHTMPPAVYDIHDAFLTDLFNRVVFSKLSFAKTFP